MGTALEGGEGGELSRMWGRGGGSGGGAKRVGQGRVQRLFFIHDLARRSL